MDEAAPDILDNDFSFNNFNENEENFSVDLPPLPGFDPSHTPQRDMSFVEEFNEGTDELQFTPTPKKNSDASSIIFPSPIRPTYGEQFSDILENDENANPEALVDQRKFIDGATDGINNSTKIAISILKEKMKDCEESITFEEISCKVKFVH